MRQIYGINFPKGVKKIWVCEKPVVNAVLHGNVAPPSILLTCCIRINKQSLENLTSISDAGYVRVSKSVWCLRMLYE